MNAAPSGCSPSGPSPPASWFTPSRQMLTWMCAPFPTEPATTLGEKLARQPWLAGDGADHLARENGFVAGPEQVGRGKRELHLPVRVLGVDLLGDDARLGQGVDQVEHERPGVPECRRSVTRPAVNRHEVPVFLPADRPLELPGGHHLDARAPRPGVRTPAHEAALAARPRLARLLVVVDRREGPTGRAADERGRVEVGPQAKVSGRAVEAGVVRE